MMITWLEPKKTNLMAKLSLQEAIIAQSYARQEELYYTTKHEGSSTKGIVQTVYHTTLQQTNLCISISCVKNLDI